MIWYMIFDEENHDRTWFVRACSQLDALQQYQRAVRTERVERMELPCAIKAGSRPCIVIDHEREVIVEVHAPNLLTAERLYRELAPSEDIEARSCARIRDLFGRPKTHALPRYHDALKPCTRENLDRYRRCGWQCPLPRTELQGEALLAELGELEIQHPRQRVPVELG